MKEFFRFIASADGRKVRVVAGLTLIGASAISKKKPNWPLIGVGLVPLSAGLFDWCVLAPFFGKPFSGKRLRKQIDQ